MEVGKSIDEDVQRIWLKIVGDVEEEESELVKGVNKKTDDRVFYTIFADVHGIVLGFKE